MSQKIIDGHTFRQNNVGKHLYWRGNVNGKDIYLHSYLYQKYQNVTLPPKKRVFFKDGDYMNFSEENLTVKRSDQKRYIPCDIDCEKGTIKRGDVVPQPNPKGYLMFAYEGKLRPAHRIIYEHFHGVKLQADQHINHINFDITDNRISNLELVTPTQNAQWRQLSTKNKSGYKGVYFDRRENKYKSRIGFHGSKLNLGTFDNAVDAAKAYNEKALELNEKQNCKYTLNVLPGDIYR